jgi:anti-sigma regulatory factor (Ser/Thr protein kinase)
MRKTLTIPATYEALEALKPFVESVESPASEKMLSQILLAIHELCVNIVQHAYAGAPGEIQLETWLDADRVKFLIRDSAPNAYMSPGNIVSPEPASLPESGWGIYIVHQVMDEVEYRRLPGGNEWLLGKIIAE